jgi:outer membrane protein TolC
VRRLSLVALLLVAGSGASATRLSADQEPAPAPLALPTLQRPVSGPFLGGVPSGEPTENVETITVVQALNRSLEHNLGVLAAQNNLGRAQGARWRALSDLLPNVNARMSETRQQINLQAFGFGASSSSPFGDVPPIVGPFNVFDARIFLTQTVLDLGALNDARAEAHNVEAARYLNQGARDFVLYVTGTVYLQALATSARADAARAQHQTAETLYNQAVDLKRSGVVAGIEVLRAEVQLTTQTQRTTIAVNEFEKAKLQLARLIGLPLGQKFNLDPNLPGLPEPDISLDEAVTRAHQTRQDYLAALERVRAAEATRQGIVGDALPSVRVNADYGAIGLSPSDALMTYSVSGAVSVPIFQGGRIKGRLLEADADLRNRRAEAEDLRGAIYYEIRTAMLDLEATSQQLTVAGKARDLAGQQLTQARDRFAAGVASNIEVVQAQDAVAVATEQFIAAQYGQTLARAALSRGIGSVEQMLRQLLGGSR